MSTAQGEANHPFKPDLTIEVRGGAEIQLFDTDEHEARVAQLRNKMGRGAS